VPDGSPIKDVTVAVHVSGLPTSAAEEVHANEVEVGRRPPPGCRGTGFPTRMLVPVSWFTGTAPHIVFGADAGGTWMFVAYVHGPAG